MLQKKIKLIHISTDEVYGDLKTSFIFQDEVSDILFKILHFKGILNLGGKSQTVYNFARKFNPKIKPMTRTYFKFLKPYPNISMNIDKMKKITKILL